MENHKTPVILLHSALGTSNDLSELETTLREQGFNPLSFTFSGHGHNPVEAKEFRIDFFAHELDRFIKNNNLESPVVFGHSMGGYIALYHKANFEDSPIRAIYGYGIKFNWTEQAVLKELPMLNPEHLEKNFPGQVELLIQKHGTGWKQLLRQTAHMIQNLEKLDGLTKEDLSDITVPVYLLLGDQDRMVTSEETTLTANSLPQGHVKTISHSKHDIQRANIKEIAEILNRGAAENFI